MNTSVKYMEVKRRPRFIISERTEKQEIEK